MLKKIFTGSVLIISSLIAGKTEVSEVEIPVVKCSKPVLSIAISEIECKAALCQQQKALKNARGGIAALAALASGSSGVSGVGDGVKTMFSNALKETNCFKIVDLEKFKKLKKMLEATGQTVKPPKIDLMISGTITSMNLSQEGGALGGGYIPVLGMISTHKQKAEITLDVNALNPTTLEMGASKTFKANSEESSWGILGAGGAVGGGWSITKNIALDNVIRDVVFRATNFFAESYAKNYIAYRPDIEKIKNKKNTNIENKSETLDPLEASDDEF